MTGGPYQEVSRDEWLQAEHDAGFRGGRMLRPSTGGWSRGGMAGVITYNDALPWDYAKANGPDPAAVVALVQELIDKERNHSGSGRDGHLGLEDLLPLAEALGIEVTR